MRDVAHGEKIILVRIVVAPKLGGDYFIWHQTLKKGFIYADGDNSAVTFQVVCFQTVTEVNSAAAELMLVISTCFIE